MGSTKDYDYEVLNSNTLAAPSSTPPSIHVIGDPQPIYDGGDVTGNDSTANGNLKTHSIPRVYFHAENLASTRRRSSSRVFGPQATYRRRSRSMSAWSDLSRSSIRFEER